MFILRLKVRGISLFRIIDTPQIYFQSVINGKRGDSGTPCTARLSKEPLIDSTPGLLLSPIYSRIK